MNKIAQDDFNYLRQGMSQIEYPSGLSAPVQRGLSAKQARMTVCLRGHPLIGKNIVWHGPGKRKRTCRICENERSRKYTAQRRERRNAAMA